MKCTICKQNDAVIHIREYSEVGIKKINLCLDCALEKGFNATVNDINNLFKNLIKNIFNIKENQHHINFDQSNKKINMVCPSCKTTINQISDTGKVGCAFCYTTFEQIIDLLIFKNNNSLNYRGRLPENLKKMQSNRALLFKLKKDLKKSVNDEDFQNAALIRDKIKEIKKEINNEVRRIANK